MAQICYYVLVFMCISILDKSVASKCVTQNPCSCAIDKYSFISLSQLHPPQKTFFQDGQADVSYFFSGCVNKDFKPEDYKLVANETIQAVSLVKCTSVVFDHDPKNASIHFNFSVVNQTCKPIGYEKDIKFDLVPSSTDQYQIIYANKSSNNSFPSIRLACDNFNTTDLKIVSSDTDALILYSPLVCVQNLSHHELSSGSIFCIIFFVAAIIYFLGGGLIMYCLRGARGVEVIPNFDFWVAIPGLIKDGLVYILSGCRPFTVSSAETYDRI